MVKATNFVIGSGPSGVTAAKALLDRGQKVVMLDVGMTLEADISGKVAALRHSPHQSWDAAVISEMKRPFIESKGALPFKYLFGSDFPYRRPEHCVDLSSTELGCKPSFARGGLSNVWGASILPYADVDLDGWPIRERDLAPYYRRVLNWIGFAGQKDGLSSLYPLYGEPKTCLNLSSQAQSLATRLEHNAGLLQKEGLTFGASRLAVRPNAFSSGCVYCGLCMVGCPYDLIYHSGDSLDELIRNPSFSYRNGIHVNRLKETNDNVHIVSSQVGDGAPIQFTGDRVFLAAGTMSSSSILLRSLVNRLREVEIQDSQYFIIPALMLKRPGVSYQTPLHTLSQLFLEIRKPEISPYTVHLQAYTFNEVYRSLLRNKLGVFARLFPSSLENRLLERLIVLQGYLHSRHSGRIRLEIEPGHSDIKATVVQNRETQGVVNLVCRYLRKHCRRLGFVPISSQSYISDVGRGYHSGGSFPMQDEPQGSTASDLFGRPTPFRRIHVVDSSVFTTIPSTTITLSAMANAYRIADTFAAKEY